MSLSPSKPPFFKGNAFLALSCLSRHLLLARCSTTIWLLSVAVLLTLNKQPEKTPNKFRAILCFDPEAKYCTGKERSHGEIPRAVRGEREHTRLYTCACARASVCVWAGAEHAWCCTGRCWTTMAPFLRIRQVALSPRHRRGEAQLLCPETFVRQYRSSS